MICFAGNLPVLQVGHHQVIGYDSGWIDEALRRAAFACDRRDFPFIADIRNGILHYLEHRCPLRVCELEDLFARMRRMLCKIGCHAIAENLTILAPPMTMSLVGPARKAGNGFELTFFQILSDEINLLRKSGAESIRFCDIEACVKILGNGLSEEKASRNLQAEIVVFLERFDKASLAPECEFHLTLDL